MIRTLTAVLLVAACSSPPSEDLCEVDTTTAAVEVQDRKVIGAGAEYDADGTLRGRDDELRRSQKSRREVAWRIVDKVLTPVPLAEVSAQIPAWQTWYGKDDLDRLFKHLYAGLGPDGRKARARFADDALDDAFGWNVTSVEELESWPVERWLGYLGQLDDPEVIASVGGLAPIAYSPSAARHVLASYPEILSCLRGGVPPAFVDTPGEATRQVVRAPVALARCTDRSFGPYFVAGDETLSAVLVAAETHAQVTVRGEGGILCNTAAGTPCEAPGPGTFYVDVSAETEAVDGVLDIRYGASTPPWAACLQGAFPLDSVVVKASWRRAQFGLRLPTYETSAPWLSWLLDPDNLADWGSGEDQADPGPEQIYTQRTPGGNTYRLAAMHIMTKELDHWTWITVWWSREPDTDFGADRPAGLDGVWRNYKMCVATAYDEGDPDPTGGFAGTLGAALAATHGGVGAPSWCSNPYLELGEGNADTNCIGCHQHGLTGAVVQDILADADSFPAHGKTLLRNNFPSDYSWAVDAGDRLGGMFANVVDYYDSFE